MSYYVKAIRLDKVKYIRSLSYYIYSGIYYTFKTLKPFYDPILRFSFLYKHIIMK